MVVEILEIEDVSDCESCTRRDDGLLEYLGTVKCNLLEDLICQECGRRYSLFVEDTGGKL